MIIHPSNIIAQKFTEANCRLILQTELPTSIGDIVRSPEGNQYRIHSVKETDNTACEWRQPGTYIEAKGKRI